MRRHRFQHTLERWDAHQARLFKRFRNKRLSEIYAAGYRLTLRKR